MQCNNLRQSQKLIISLNKIWVNRKCCIIYYKLKLIILLLKLNPHKELNLKLLLPTTAIAIIIRLNLLTCPMNNNNNNKIKVQIKLKYYCVPNAITRLRVTVKYSELVPMTREEIRCIATNLIFSKTKNRCEPTPQLTQVLFALMWCVFHHIYIHNVVQCLLHLVLHKSINPTKLLIKHFIRMMYSLQIILILLIITIILMRVWCKSIRVLQP